MQMHFYLLLKIALQGEYSTQWCRRTRAAFQHLLFGWGARSAIYCQIIRNSFCLALWYLFTIGGNDDYEFMTPHCFTYLQLVAESYIPTDFLKL